MKDIDPVALFRLSVPGPLVSRERLERGELQAIIRDLAQREDAIPHSRRRFPGKKTIEAWFHAFRKHGIEGLRPKPRSDRGVSKISVKVQEALLAESAGAIWYGEVMHGPKVPVRGQWRKTCLVSLFDDASRLIAHSAFALGETALDIEGVLKPAVLIKRTALEVDRR